jgi:hypothetical protein
MLVDGVADFAGEGEEGDGHYYGAAMGGEPIKLRVLNGNMIIGGGSGICSLSAGWVRGGMLAGLEGRANQSGLTRC